MADTKLLIGWYDAGSKRFCYTDVKETLNREGYTIPVYAHISDDVKQLKEKIKEFEALRDTVSISCNPPADCNDPKVLKTYMKACFDEAEKLYN